MKGSKLGAGSFNLVNRLVLVMAILVSLSFLTTYSLPAYSGIVTTEQLMEEQLESLDKDTLVSLMDREEVRQQLIDRGVDPDYAKQRIAALSDQQISEIKANIDELPAGSSVVGILIAVLLVLVILSSIMLPQLGNYNRLARYVKVREDVGALCASLDKMLKEIWGSAFLKYPRGRGSRSEGYGYGSSSGDAREPIGLLVGPGDDVGPAAIGAGR